MIIEEMTYSECLEMLTRARLAHLACAADNQPYVVPIHIDFAEGSLFGYSTLGQKINWMRVNPLVCVEIDESTGQNQWATLIISGRYEELAATPENAYARRVAERVFERHPVWWEPASVTPVGRPARQPVLFRILVCAMTGRRAKPEVPIEPAPPSRVMEERRAGWLSRAWHQLRAILPTSN
jgi:nitroimidazol reductase NimA-like FMN-containing flavoprotein (pyridoxamine 5'-phosphate oxidase superfamily)